LLIIRAINYSSVHYTICWYLNFHISFGYTPYSLMCIYNVWKVMYCWDIYSFCIVYIERNWFRLKHVMEQEHTPQLLIPYTTSIIIIVIQFKNKKTIDFYVPAYYSSFALYPSSTVLELVLLRVEVYRYYCSWSFFLGLFCRGGNIPYGTGTGTGRGEAKTKLQYLKSSIRK
jgi:hypothetical protein